VVNALRYREGRLINCLRFVNCLLFVKVLRS